MSEGAPERIPLITIANVLTYSRLVLLPFVIVGVTAKIPLMAVIAMVLVVVTDMLDGRMARRYNQAGPFGKTLDSTVDFTMIYCAFIAFYAAGRLMTYQFAVLYLAMLTILTLQLVLGGTGHGEEVATTRLGKPTGAMQFLYLLFLVAIELVPENATIALIHQIYFGILAVLIVLNSIECISVMCRLMAPPAQEA